MGKFPLFPPSCKLSINLLGYVADLVRSFIWNLLPVFVWNTCTYSRWVCLWYLRSRQNYFGYMLFGGDAVMFRFYSFTNLHWTAVFLYFICSCQIHLWASWYPCHFICWFWHGCKCTVWNFSSCLSLIFFIENSGHFMKEFLFLRENISMRLVPSTEKEYSLTWYVSQINSLCVVKDISCLIFLQFHMKWKRNYLP